MVKKVLIFSLAYYPKYVGGAEVAIKEITDRISPKEVSFDMVTVKLDGKQKSFEKIGNVDVYRVGLGVEFFDKFSLPLIGFLKARSLQKKKEYDLSWAMMANQAGVAASFFKLWFKKVPLILTIQEGDEEEYLKRYVLGSEILYKIFIKPWHLMPFKLADKATAISQSLKDRIERNKFSGPIEIIPNGVDPKLFKKGYSAEELNQLKKDLKIKKGDKIIITTSRLVEKNAIEDIILSLNYLPKKYKLLILGSGHLLFKLQNLAENNNLYNRVQFLGHIDRGAMPKYLKISDVFVRPSISEGQGISFIEAMSAGVPIIATPVGGIKDFLKDRETGLVCGVHDPKSIALNVRLLEKDEILRESIAKKALTLSDSYDWNLIAKRMQTFAFSGFSKNSQKIIIATGIFPPAIGGPAYYALNLLKEFKNLGHQASVVTYGSLKKLPSGLRHFAFFLKLLLKSIRADFILSLDTFSVGLPAVWLKVITGKKLLIRIGGDFLWEMHIRETGERVFLSDFYKNKNIFSAKAKKIFDLTKYVLDKADVLIFSTSWQEEIFAKAYNLDRNKNFIVENFYGKKKRVLLPKRKNFLWAGRDLTLKNLEVLKKAFNLAKESDSSVELDIFSEVSQDELLKKVSESYAVILPSISEVSPNFILEAVLYGKPFIMTKDTGIKERLAAVGIFVNPLDEEEIKEKILYLARDENYKMQKKKVNDFNFEHSYKEIAEEILAVNTNIQMTNDTNGY